jgi:hypothetical protein
VNLGFEAAQHPHFKLQWAQALRTSAGDGAFARPVLNYVFLGTFDRGDVFAIILGAAAAAGLLHLVDSRLETCHATR